MKISTFVALVALAGLAACSEGPSTVRSVAVSAQPNFAISDGAHSGNTHFYFLPPMVSTPTTTGTFDAQLAPTVEICVLANGECAALLATYTTTSGAGSETIRLDADQQQYLVNWHTDLFTLSDASIYRIRVRVGGTQLGFADVQPVLSAKELKNVATGQYVPLVEGRTLPIKFRVETGVIAAIAVRPSVKELAPGDRQAFVAELSDLHGNALDGRSVTWASSDERVVTVNASGIATAVASGTATVVASSEGTTGSAAVTVTVMRLGPAMAVSAGLYHTCALDLSGMAFCWGRDDQGQLGVAHAESCAIDNGAAVACALVPLPVATSLRFSAIDAGNVYTCALAPAGDAYCWGSGEHGQLGDGRSGTGTLSAAPVRVAAPIGLLFVALSVGAEHACGLTSAGALWCWGRNDFGQLGIGSFSDASVPTPVAAPAGVQFTTVEAGVWSSCAIDGTGTAWCWGSYGAGELGLWGVENTPKSSPQKVYTDEIPVKTFQSIAGGDQFTCAIATGGAGYCFGWGGAGNLGYGSSQWPSQRPEPMNDGRTYAAVFAGAATACALTPGAEAWCWGADEYGQTGNAALSTECAARIPCSPSATPVLGGLTFKTLSVGQHTCGIALADSRVYCWGRGIDGELGRGTRADEMQPGVAGGERSP